MGNPNKGGTGDVMLVKASRHAELRSQSLMITYILTLKSCFVGKMAERARYSYIGMRSFSPTATDLSRVSGK